jgi:hypothetical protein
VLPFGGISLGPSASFHFPPESSENKKMNAILADRYGKILLAPTGGKATKRALLEEWPIPGRFST